MRRLNKPTQDAGDTFSTCVSLVRNPAMRGHLASLRQRIEAAATDYEAKGLLAAWHSIVQTAAIGAVPKSELVKTYKNRMAKPNAPGRSIYDELIVVPQRRCPLCGQRDVSTLDHYLPEAHYTLLVVLPVNLVPACKDCNFKKLGASPSSPETQTFHPYYDNFDDAIWLEADVIESDSLGILFRVRQPDEWNETKFRRAKHHFKMMELGDLYSDHAVGELVEIKADLVRIFDAGGQDAIRADLASRAVPIRVVRPNSWRAALYTAAAASEWFCREGFQLIPE